MPVLKLLNMLKATETSGSGASSKCRVRWSSLAPVESMKDISEYTMLSTPQSVKKKRIKMISSSNFTSSRSRRSALTDSEAFYSQPSKESTAKSSTSRTILSVLLLMIMLRKEIKIHFYLSVSQAEKEKPVISSASSSPTPCQTTEGKHQENC